MNGGIDMFNSNCASVPLVASIDGGYGGNNGFLNGDGLWGLIIILALLGWGGNGFGGFGGFGGGRVEPCATQADVRAAVDQQTLISKLDQQTYGLADSTYALNNAITSGFNGVQATLCQGFNGVDRAIADCCCTTQRAIDGVNYNMATQACDIKHAINDSTRSILDFLTTDKIATLQAENQNLKLKASQAEQNAYITANQQAQTAELIRRLGADCPVNAYVVQPPTPVTFPTNCCGQFSGYGYGGSCGCGCA
jgi:hypothetical protein